MMVMKIGILGLLFGVNKPIDNGSDFDYINYDKEDFKRVTKF